MKKLSKRFLTLAIACVMAMAMAVPAFAADKDTYVPSVDTAASAVPTNQKLHIYSKAYNGAYLNVETTGTPKSKDNVGVWQYTDHDSQRWYIELVSQGKYRVGCYSNTDVTLNIYYPNADPYSSGSQLHCTVYPWRLNSVNDYMIKIVDESTSSESNVHGFVLPTYVKCMSATGGSNGNDVLWKAADGSATQLWKFMLK